MSLVLALKACYFTALWHHCGLSLNTEAILAHELAHIYRKDYLINMLQALVETLFLTRPTGGSKIMRIERENCCEMTGTAVCALTAHVPWLPRKHPKSAAAGFNFWSKTACCWAVLSAWVQQPNLVFYFRKASWQPL